jgi:hypothetical protein
VYWILSSRNIAQYAILGWYPGGIFINRRSDWVLRFIFLFSPQPLLLSVTIMPAEVNLAWWLAWTSNPVGIYRKVGSVGSIPMHLRHFIFNRLQTCRYMISWLSSYQPVAVSVDFMPKLCPNS